MSILNPLGIKESKKFNMNLYSINTAFVGNGMLRWFIYYIPQLKNHADDA